MLELKYQQKVDMLKEYGFNYQGRDINNDSMAFTKINNEDSCFQANIFKTYVTIKLKGQTQTENGMRSFFAAKRIGLKQLNEPMLQKVLVILNQTRESV